MFKKLKAWLFPKSVAFEKINDDLYDKNFKYYTDSQSRIFDRIIDNGYRKQDGMLKLHRSFQEEILMLTEWQFGHPVMREMRLRLLNEKYKHQ